MQKLYKGDITKNSLRHHYYIYYPILTSSKKIRSSKFEKVAHVRRSVYRVAPEAPWLKHNGHRKWPLETK